MSLKTHSKFYYGFVVSADAYIVDFKEGTDPAIFATLTKIGYSLTDFATELARAMTEAGTQTYTVSVDRATRKLTISAASAFTLLTTSGDHVGVTALTLAGFTGADTGSATSHQGGAAGSEYATQFILQSYVDPEDFQNSVYATVNKAASGRIEVVSYGQENFMCCEIKFVTNLLLGANSIVRQNATGYSDLRSLLKYLITKAPLEFMPDEDAPDTFTTLILESTPDDTKGLKYKLQEMFTQNLPGFFQTGLLTFRVVED